MEAKLSWRRTRLFHINVALYLLILLVMILFGRELRWAFNEFPGYWNGTIGSPVERKLYREAKSIIQGNHNMTNAQELLEQSIAIDPHTDAVFWLGEYFLQTHQEDQALEQFNRFLEVDPTEVDAYSKVASILEKKKRYEEARQALQKGILYFESQLTKYRPRINPEVRATYNHKALRVFSQYERAAQRLKIEIHRLEGRKTLNGDKA